MATFKHSANNPKIMVIFIGKDCMVFTIMILIEGLHKVKMILPHSLKESVFRSPYYLALDVWNQLDENVQKMDFVWKYKKQLKLMDLNVIKF